MTLLIDELYNGIVFEQNFRIQKSMQLAHFRPWIYKHGSPSTGEMVLQILQNNEVLKEVRLSFDEINANIIGTYAHGPLRFDTEPLQLNHNRNNEYTDYQIKLFMDNYVTDTNNFYGVIRRYELKIYDTYGGTVVNNEAGNDMIEPMGFELFEYTY